MAEKKADTLVKVQEVTLAALDPDQAVDLTAIAEEFGDDELKITKLLTPVKMPKDARTFEIDNPEDHDDPESVKAIEGVIIGTHRINAYYSSPYVEGEKTAPDCLSVDGKVGHGSREKGGVDDAGLLEHECKTCPLNEFGTNERGGKACANRRNLYILRDSDVFPLVLSLSPTRLSTFDAYKLDLVKVYKGRRFASGVVTKITLAPGKDGSTIAPKFELVGPLDDGVAAACKRMGRDIVAMATEFVPAILTATTTGADDEAGF